MDLPTLPFSLSFSFLFRASLFLSSRWREPTLFTMTVLTQTVSSYSPLTSAAVTAEPHGAALSRSISPSAGVLSQPRPF